MCGNPFKSIKKFVDDLTGHSAREEADRLMNEEARAATAAAEQAAAEREENIRLGRSTIDDLFSQFDDSFFSGYVTDFENNYFPRLDDDFSKAKGDITAELARKGMLGSTAGSNLMRDQVRAYEDARRDISGRAVSGADDLRAQIEAQRDSLYNLNTSVADPTQVSNAANLRAQTFLAPPTYSSLGEVFQSAVQPAVAAVQARNNRVDPNFNVGRYKSPIGDNTSRIVR